MRTWSWWPRDFQTDYQNGEDSFRWAGLSVSETVALLEFSFINICTVHIERRKYLVPCWCRSQRRIVTQIALVITKIWRRTSLSAQHLEPWSRCTRAVENHTGCQQKTESRTGSLRQLDGPVRNCHSNMKVWSHPACTAGIFSWQTWHSTNWALFKCQSLHYYDFWPFASLYHHSVFIFWWLLLAG